MSHLTLPFPDLMQPCLLYRLIGAQCDAYSRTDPITPVVLATALGGYQLVCAQEGLPRIEDCTPNQVEQVTQMMKVRGSRILK